MVLSFYGNSAALLSTSRISVSVSVLPSNSTCISAPVLFITDSDKSAPMFTRIAVPES